MNWGLGVFVVSVGLFVCFICGAMPLKMQRVVAWLVHKVKGSKDVFEFDQVEDCLWMGRRPLVEEDVELLRSKGVGLVLCVLEEREMVVGKDCIERKGIEMKVVHVPDFFAPSVHQIEESLHFIRNGLEKGVSVYIHCKGGKGRSAVIAICHLMHKYSWTRRQAYEFLRGKRSITGLDQWCGVRPQWRVIEQWRLHRIKQR